MRAKWADFLFTLAVRFFGGAVLGVLASFLALCPGRSAGPGSHPLLVWVAGDEAHPHRFIHWLICWAVGGGIIGVFTTPYWQRPWYKYESCDLKQDKPTEDTRLSSLRWTRRSSKKSERDDDAA